MSAQTHVYPKGCVFQTIEDIKDKHITIMGLGLNGGGLASVRFFLKHGAYVIATDMKTESQLKPTIDALESDPSLDISRLTYRLGKHVIDDFKNADCVIKNPGIKYDGNTYLAAAKAIETDLSIFLHFTKAPIIAVTGSKGKSSTVSAIYYGLTKSGFTAFLGGNITVSPLTFLDKTSENTPVVLELSSWQLADLRGRQALHPYIAIITKIVPDHQNWYHNMEDYIADKRLIYTDQTAQDYTIIDADEDEPGTGPINASSWGALFAQETKATVLYYSRKELPANMQGVWQSVANNTPVGQLRLRDGTAHTILKDLIVPGEHMRTNALNAALVLHLMHVADADIISILQTWPGIEHRLQYFHQYKTAKTVIRFYNDSCATVPEAAAAATQAFNEPVVCITGGTDKGLEFTKLADTLACTAPNIIPVHALYLLAGTGTDKLVNLLQKQHVSYQGPYNSLDALLSSLKKDLDADTSQDHLAVVFTPGATSFGMFNNEFDRGNQFMSKTKALFSTIC
ncbi:MAG: UDP-N-acetylmuramoyl-L-alanine--D-glutamate ligase [Treponema sp.]|nr:UDP-N-acetylmuramoyl-L-alanine--D-glutamate ligase [Treponema sp.]